MTSPSPKKIDTYPFLSPELGFKQEFLFARDRIPVNGIALGYELGLSYGVGLQREGKDAFHIPGFRWRFKDLYTLRNPRETKDLKSFALQFFYNYDGKFSVATGPGYSWSRRQRDAMTSTDGFHWNADVRINPLVLAEKVTRVTFDVQLLDLSVYLRDGSVGLGAGIFLKMWFPLT